MKYFKTVSILTLLVFGSFQGVTERVLPGSTGSLELNETLGLCPPNYVQLPARYNIRPEKWEAGDIVVVLCPVIPFYLANGACCVPIKPE
jgi:hypothetical protein